MCQGVSPAGMCGAAGRARGRAQGNIGQEGTKPSMHGSWARGVPLVTWKKANNSWIHGGARHHRGHHCQGIPHPQHSLSECHTPELWAFLQQAWLPDKLAGHSHCYNHTYTSSHGRCVQSLSKSEPTSQGKQAERDRMGAWALRGLGLRCHESHWRNQTW